MKRIHLALACLLATAGLPTLSAQESPFVSRGAADDRVHITIVLTDREAPTTLLRRAGPGERNIILMHADSVDAQRLSDAVFQLLILEAQDPEGQGRADNQAQRMRIGTSRPAYPWAAEAVERLRTAARRQLRAVAGGRRHRALEVWMPRLRPATR